MDIKAYISSGILELYVLDQLSSEQRTEVEGYAVQHPEILAEISNIENALLLYSTKTAIEPPANLEASILKKINDVEKSKSSEKTATSGGSMRWLTPLLAASLLLVVGWSFWLFQKSNQQQTEIVELKNSIDLKAIECAETDLRNQNLEEQLRHIRSTSNQTIRMNGTDKSSQALATIYWNPDAKKTYLDVNNLPTPPSGKQYQLWAIVAGTPVDMGVFEIDLTANVLQEVPNVEGAQAFAITLEPKGGSKTPTLDEMVVIGEVG